jgi:hypothetical protein
LRLRKWPISVEGADEELVSSVVELTALDVRDVLDDVFAVERDVERRRTVGYGGRTMSGRKHSDATKSLRGRAD